mgnify:FL=1
MKSVITRKSAYQWFREKYLLLISTSPCMQMTSNYYQQPIQKFEPRVSKVGLEKEFVEVVFQNQRPGRKMAKEEKLYVVWVKCESVSNSHEVTTSRVPVYMMQNGGRGAFICSNTLTPGQHTINGATLLVTAATNIATNTVSNKTANTANTAVTNSVMVAPLLNAAAHVSVRDSARDSDPSNPSHQNNKRRKTAAALGTGENQVQRLEYSMLELRHQVEDLRQQLHQQRQTHQQYQHQQQ